VSDRSKLSRRFEELVAQLDVIAATKHHASGTMMSGDYIDDNAFTKWKLNARNLLALSCGGSSLHFQDFAEREKGTYGATNYLILLKLKAVFEAAQDDFNGGYCNSLRTLIQSEVFDSELDQARELLAKSHLSAAAVISGVVLETTLRQLCDNHQIAHSKLGKMNDDLTKVGQYNVLRQKQVTSWAQIRNDAAHGHTERFTRDDVADMIEKVEAFVAEQL
jgi:hypothetical protein